MHRIGQGLQQRRWANPGHRRPVFDALWTALWLSCGQQDHGENHALPQSVKNRSNDSV